jgi:pimeloyl-ACP methyl ester carboxylesterase
MSFAATRTSRHTSGGRAAAGLLTAITIPALAITGENSPPFPRNTAKRPTAGPPGRRLIILPGQTHDTNSGATAPVLADLLAC